MVQTQKQSTTTPHEAQDTYFDFQAEIGLTKHIGGFQATHKLLELCELHTNSLVLDVGCGVGQTARHIVHEYDARVVGIDLRPAMIEKAMEIARKQGSSQKSHFYVADAQSLPPNLDEEMFDAVICESVLAFVPDKQKALSEFIRVTKPGGYIGFTEAIWLHKPSDEELEAFAKYTGPESNLQLSEEWEALIRSTQLNNIIVESNPLELMSDASSQIKQFGVGHLVRAWGKTAKLMLTQPKYRGFIGDAARMPKGIMKNMGYGIYVGQKAM